MTVRFVKGLARTCSVQSMKVGCVSVPKVALFASKVRPKDATNLRGPFRRLIDIRMGQLWSPILIPTSRS
jgi:hypothetical protein